MVQEGLKCYHCGLSCEGTEFIQQDKTFCCYGCQVVYEIIQDNNLCQYYDYERYPGSKLRWVDVNQYDYLDICEIGNRVLEFSSPNFARVQFLVPTVHCVSCIWLLENIRKLDHGIIKSEVNFGKKTITVDFHPQQIALSRVASILATVGYAPVIQPQQEQNQVPAAPRTMVIQLAIAGFCFGNVMLFSFPEYLGLDHHDKSLGLLFSWLNIALSIPVLVFSAKDYFVSSWRSLLLKKISIDVPIAFGLIALFSRSIWDISTGYGPGYLDSFTGLVFFLLIGRWFQGKTYESLSFDRDFKSYFPLATQKLTTSGWKYAAIRELEVGDRIRVRNQEIIPADCVLEGPDSFIDYSFVTGESKPVSAVVGDSIYAGGRLLGPAAVFLVQRKTSQSYLTSIWNHESFRKPGGRSYQRFIDQSAKVFTWAVLAIAFCTAVYWYSTQPDQMWPVLTSVLIVACPCALALAAPFTYGSMLRAFGGRGFYLKSADVIEKLAHVNAIVFDKTGTVTHGLNPDVFFEGSCSKQELASIKVLTGFSAHPMSRLISESIPWETKEVITQFKEFPGMGIEGLVGKVRYKVGSAAFTGAAQDSKRVQSRVYVSIDQAQRGHFGIGSTTRPGMKAMISQLGDKCVALLSGDGDSERAAMEGIFDPRTILKFDQGPHDKRAYVETLQKSGKSVMMVGDGLNDAGALKQSDVGISVSDDAGIFVPSCDGILQGNRMASLNSFLHLAGKARGILYASFAISLIYNAITMSFAVTGQLSPLIAAVLMPMSSITVVLFSSVAVRWAAARENFNRED